MATRTSRPGLVERTCYRANDESAIYDELRGIVRKTMGIPQELAAALAPIKRKIAVALLYGSVARVPAISVDTGDERCQFAGCKWLKSSSWSG